MNKAVTDLKPEAEVSLSPVDRLALLRRPFADHQVSKLPKETGKQAEDRKAAVKAGNWPKRCAVCDGFHHEKAVHLDYVGHAALTDRLLDVDPQWNWEPMAVTPEGLPAFDRVGGLWIKLTICGVTRIGYGTAPGKEGGDAIKEIIGDALRNGGMRFGAALDLWHKGDLHAHDEEDERPAADATKTTGAKAPEPPTLAQRAHKLTTALRAQTNEADVRKAYGLASKLCADLSMNNPELLRTVEDVYAEALSKFAPPAAEEPILGDDEIPF